MKTAKQIKEAAKVVHHTNLAKMITKVSYIFTPDEMQAFEDAICREQKYEIWEPTMNSMIMDELGPEWREYLEQLINNAPKPTT